MTYQHTFTVVTATYNRAHTIHRTYESLRAQTFRDFEGLVIDDGSTDGTRALIEGWTKEAWFPIRYIYQANAGKHVACNRAAREARGELITGLDSDDGCVPHALERLKFHWDRIPAAERERFAGVAALCVDERGKLHGTPFPRDITDSDSVEIRYRYKVKGEKWGFMRAEVVRAFPFPEPANVRFVTEAFIYREIARRYKLRYVNEPLRIYYEHDPDQSSRLVNSATKHAASMRLYYREVLRNDLKWFRFAPINFLRSAANYCRFGYDCGIGTLEQLGQLGNIWAQLLWLVALPVGFAYHVADTATARHARATS
jgi:glycosyltransferase involved in cell wall biosynthesis